MITTTNNVDDDPPQSFTETIVQLLNEQQENQITIDNNDETILLNRFNNLNQHSFGQTLLWLYHLSFKSQISPQIQNQSIHLLNMMIKQERQTVYQPSEQLEFISFIQKVDPLVLFNHLINDNQSQQSVQNEVVTSIFRTQRILTDKLDQFMTHLSIITMDPDHPQREITLLFLESTIISLLEYSRIEKSLSPIFFGYLKDNTNRQQRIIGLIKLIAKKKKLESRITSRTMEYFIFKTFLNIIGPSLDKDNAAGATGVKVSKIGTFVGIKYFKKYLFQFMEYFKSMDMIQGGSLLRYILPLWTKHYDHFNIYRPILMKFILPHVPSNINVQQAVPRLVNHIEPYFGCLINVLVEIESIEGSDIMVKILKAKVSRQGLTATNQNLMNHFIVVLLSTCIIDKNGLEITKRLSHIQKMMQMNGFTIPLEIGQQMITLHQKIESNYFLKMITYFRQPKDNNGFINFEIGLQADLLEMNQRIITSIFSINKLLDIEEMLVNTYTLLLEILQFDLFWLHITGCTSFILSKARFLCDHQQQQRGDNLAIEYYQRIVPLLIYYLKSRVLNEVPLENIKADGYLFWKLVLQFYIISGKDIKKVKEDLLSKPGSKLGPQFSQEIIDQVVSFIFSTLDDMIINNNNSNDHNHLIYIQSKMDEMII
ncbi:hypothetical protein DFA_00425 [Cavenderia fasciculata]|uniref:Uncharacterized protein n=1 Tax=Cavenderia fasciculata TaxID=261658 RepID=F4PRR5_CACFS|nr:uncharacterized protein DFA_00425 [Cavenderia fasciculata]EGG20564.1 hypothetical protein DFA_00425 [Cavenderia fasciculata]|eukprot:XP_004358414.1 hypothetical protein DFA_00425 [Cavenderia fasciculata]